MFRALCQSRGLTYPHPQRYVRSLRVCLLSEPQTGQNCVVGRAAGSTTVAESSFSGNGRKPPVFRHGDISPPPCQGRLSGTGLGSVVAYLRSVLYCLCAKGVQVPVVPDKIAGDGDDPQPRRLPLGLQQDA